MGSLRVVRMTSVMVGMRSEPEPDDVSGAADHGVVLQESVGQQERTTWESIRGAKLLQQWWRDRRHSDVDDRAAPLKGDPKDAVNETISDDYDDGGIKRYDAHQNRSGDDVRRRGRLLKLELHRRVQLLQKLWRGRYVTWGALGLNVLRCDMVCDVEVVTVGVHVVYGIGGYVGDNKCGLSERFHLQEPTTNKTML